MIGKLNNKGFMFIETVITVVILTTTLILLYSSYSNVINVEKKRLYYDDIAYVYKTATIADILRYTLDQEKFDDNVNNNDKYVYGFNYGSDIFRRNNMLLKAKELFNFTILFYVKIEDIPDFKKCFNGNDDTEKCTKTKSFVAGYGGNNFSDYISKMDVPSEEGENGYFGHEGILISVIHETKNGKSPEYADTKYEECLQSEISRYYGIDDSASETAKKEYIKKYYADDTISFNMQCENVNYISWVYL